MNDIEILEEYVKLCKETGMDKRRGQAIENLISRVKNLESIEQIHREDNGKLSEEVKKAYNEGYFKGVRDERDNTEEYIKEKIKYYKQKRKIDRDNHVFYDCYIAELEDLLQEEM